MWAVLTRLAEPEEAQDHRTAEDQALQRQELPGFTEDSIKELRKRPRARACRASARAISRTRSPTRWSRHRAREAINPFMVMNELEKGLRHHSLITDEEQRKRYTGTAGMVKREYEDIVKSEVQRAISADEDAIKQAGGQLHRKHQGLHAARRRCSNRYTGQDEEPDERLMRSIEEKIDIPESRKDDFRQEIMNYIGALAVDGKRFEYNTNDRLLKALELKLFEDQKDTHQAEEPGLQRGRRGNAGEDRRGQDSG